MKNMTEESAKKLGKERKKCQKTKNKKKERERERERERVLVRKT